MMFDLSPEVNKYGGGLLEVAATEGHLRQQTILLLRSAVAACIDKMNAAARLCDCLTICGSDD